MRPPSPHYTTLDKRHTVSRTCSTCGQTKTGDLMKYKSYGPRIMITSRCLDCHKQAVKESAKNPKPKGLFTPSKWRPVKYPYDGPIAAKTRQLKFKAKFHEVQAKLYEITLAGFSIDKKEHTALIAERWG